MTTHPQSRLLVTSGDGPRECRRAVSHILRQIEREAKKAGIRFQAEIAGEADNEDPSSALVTLTGAASGTLSLSWTGTVQWTCKSPFRPHHKRQNWFVGVFAVGTATRPVPDLEASALKTETFRSGGPGGQHQNTTDSGVRITHLPTGLTATSTDERSQHRNRQVALERLKSKLFLKREEGIAREKSAQNQLHKQLERGNPCRMFKGERFTERR
ncbi:Peptide chain release factor 2 [Labrenzia sp. THAF82]|uniref:peptide chain release factor H n=1 Tax=Labrenzia sp. THAF82 TaxID=2587861 RepID=UPI001267ED88|nr:peptide chain release factor H [Labrenzia sp. THAF82]QFT31370.1 Peptide chain release factor 2 [Labrenzia sp. THAF82]